MCQHSGAEETKSVRSIEPQELFSDSEGPDEPAESGVTGLSILSSHCADADTAAERAGLLDRAAGKQPYHLGTETNSPVTFGQAASRSAGNKGSSGFVSGPPQQAAAAFSDSGASSPRGSQRELPDGATCSDVVAAGEADTDAEEQDAEEEEEEESDGVESGGDEEVEQATGDNDGESSELDEDFLLRLGASGRATQSTRRSSAGDSSAIRSEDDSDLDVPM
mmetsp:Transcript_61370/g.121475  ORF Transcript_61370/g.121475 Transcript_61370/m.121475 type:complete len:222 (-) Transcript_61370:78-743(-)